jgi:hypothetical protein
VFREFTVHTELPQRTFAVAVENPYRVRPFELLACAHRRIPLAEDRDVFEVSVHARRVGVADPR